MFDELALDIIDFNAVDYLRGLDCVSAGFANYALVAWLLSVGLRFLAEGLRVAPKVLLDETLDWFFWISSSSEADGDRLILLRISLPGSRLGELEL